jgi:glycosyltransferase involved in cell wall biosynthesis
MKLLYITSKPAYPAIDGGCFAIQRFLDALLLGNHEITYLTFETHKHPFDQKAWPEKIIQAIDLHSVFIDTKVRPFPMLTKTIGGNSYHISRFRTPDLSLKISQILQSNQFEAIVLDGLYSAACLEDIRKLSKSKVYLRTHNVEHEIWKTLAQNSKSAGKSFIIRILSQALQKDEITLLREVDGIFSISSEDTKKFRTLGIDTPIVDIPVSIETGEAPTSVTENNYFFIGGMDWAPNKEAVDLLISTIFPAIKTKLPDAQLTIAGTGTDQLSAGNGINCLGFVPDNMAFMRESGTLLLPLKSGSGVRIKILEAMSIGVPIVTTSIGKEGINALDCMSIADATDAFIIAAIALQNNSELKEKFAQNSRAYIQANYSPTTVSIALNEILH